MIEKKQMAWQNLPLECMECVVNFAAQNVHQSNDFELYRYLSIVQHRRYEFERYNQAMILKTLATVCKPWYFIMSQIHPWRQQQKIKWKNQESIDEYGQKVIEDDVQLVELTRQITKNTRLRYLQIEYRWSKDLLLDWTPVFLACPRLVRLSISEVSIYCNILEDILMAASQFCPHLEIIKLESMSAYIKKPTRILNTALARLYQLKQQTRAKPLRVVYTKFWEGKEFVEGFIKYCPQIEEFAMHENDLKHAELWYQFCQTCVQLKKFQFDIAPFNEAVVDTWSRFSKSQLEYLRLRIGDHSISDDRIYKGSMTNVIKGIVSPCPALRILSFEYTNAVFQQSLNSECIRTLAECCPKLCDLSISIDYEHRDARYPTISLDDSCLQFLFSHTHLNHLELIRICVTCPARGILRFLDCSKSVAFRSLSLFMSPEIEWYPFVMEFLELVIAAPESIFAKKSFVIRLIFTNETGWRSSPSYFTERNWRRLSQIKEQMLVSHPSIRFRIEGVDVQLKQERATSSREFYLFTIDTRWFTRIEINRP